MSWLHFHGKRPAVDPETGEETGDVEDYEENLEVTGPVRVQAMTAGGFQSHEMSPEGLNAVEVYAENPNPDEEPAPEEAEPKSSSKSSKSS
jgi:redox-sensitive bicupin YhaK (pirin superfamily)